MILGHSPREPVNPHAWLVSDGIESWPSRYYRIERDAGQGFEAIANVTTPVQSYTDADSLRLEIFGDNAIALLIGCDVGV